MKKTFFLTFFSMYAALAILASDNYTSKLIYSGQQLCESFTLSVKASQNGNKYSSISNVEWAPSLSADGDAIINLSSGRRIYSNTTLVYTKKFIITLHNENIVAFDNMRFSIEFNTELSDLIVNSVSFSDYYEDASGRSKTWIEGSNHHLTCELRCTVPYADSEDITFDEIPEELSLAIQSITITYDTPGFHLVDTTAVLGEPFAYPIPSGHDKYTYTSSNPEVAVVLDSIYNPDEEYTSWGSKRINGYVLPITEGTTVITAHNIETSASSSYTLNVVYQPQAEGTSETIIVEQPGTLRELMSELESTRVRDLTLHGKLNAEDLKYLNEHTGRLQNLESIDMKDVTFEYGGEAYATRSEGGGGFIGNIDHRYFLSDENRIEKGGSTNMLGGYDGWVNHYTNRLDALFCGLTTIRRVVWPDCVKAIGEHALAGSGIVSFLFPDEITYVGEGAFTGCKNICSVDIPSTVTELRNAFSGCTSLVNVGDLSQLKKVDEGAFADCHHLIGNVHDMTLDLTNVDTIPIKAFYECRLLQKVKLGNGLKCISGNVGDYYWSDGSFRGSFNLSRINLPEGLTEIGGSAFQGCVSLTDVTLPSTVRHISSTSFNGTPYLENQPYEDNIKYLGHVAIEMENKSESLTIKEGTTVIADNFLVYGDPLVSITLPSSIKCIGTSAFEGCKEIKTINLPEGLEEIGRRAFRGTELSGVRLPSTLKYLGGCAFAYNKNLDIITLPESLEYLGARVFQKCIGIVQVNLQYAQEQKTGGDYYGPTSGQIGEKLFYQCTGIEKVTVGPSVPKIYDGMFEGCTNLRKVVFEDRQSSDTLAIGNRAFYGCTSLLTSEIQGSNNSSKQAPRFAPEDNEPTLTIPGFTSAVGENTFCGCESLKSIVVSDGITVLPNYIFYRCPSVEKIYLPSSLDSLGDKALCFIGSKENHPFDLYCAAKSVPKLPISRFGSYGRTYNPFQPNLTDCRLFVVPETVELYQATEFWNKFEILADESLDIEITIPDASRNHDNQIFNLQGHKVRQIGQRLPRGIYVVDGKKILIR